ncbi:hypothetical protein EYC84_010914 [Monilinia fructicola]|uniref:Uncharacterized protein n=1 Tax=Monilinia fructicola TaxID=38448 RepID=A0A5M9JD78_MONFR|nr:hypothetical protein EYC84_010914 [Monilinia fructicola]
MVRLVRKGRDYKRGGALYLEDGWSRYNEAKVKIKSKTSKNGLMMNEETWIFIVIYEGADYSVVTRWMDGWMDGWMCSVCVYQSERVE